MRTIKELRYHKIHKTILIHCKNLGKTLTDRVSDMEQNVHVDMCQVLQIFLNQINTFYVEQIKNKTKLEYHHHKTIKQQETNVENVIVSFSVFCI